MFLSPEYTALSAADAPDLCDALQIYAVMAREHLGEAASKVLFNRQALESGGNHRRASRSRSERTPYGMSDSEFEVIVVGQRDVPHRE